MAKKIALNTYTTKCYISKQNPLKKTWQHLNSVSHKKLLAKNQWFYQRFLY